MCFLVKLNLIVVVVTKLKAKFKNTFQKNRFLYIVVTVVRFCEDIVQHHILLKHDGKRDTSVAFRFHRERRWEIWSQSSDPIQLIAKELYY